jgi:hypothetical protein
MDGVIAMWPFKRKDWRITSAEPKFGYQLGQPVYRVLIKYADGREEFARWCVQGMPRCYAFPTEAEARRCAEWVMDECRR